MVIVIKLYVGKLCQFEILLEFSQTIAYYQVISFIIIIVWVESPLILNITQKTH